MCHLRLIIESILRTFRFLCCSEQDIGAVQIPLDKDVHYSAKVYEQRANLNEEVKHCTKIPLMKGCFAQIRTWASVVLRRMK